MFSLILILSLFILTPCEYYKKLAKYDSVNVAPNTHVYLDISSFKTGDTITIEIDMDVFFGDDKNKKQYDFQIDQVSASSYSDYNSWKYLRPVNNSNVSCSGWDCAFTWNEIKRAGSNYIFIIPPSPFSDYEFFEKTIKIRHMGGLSAGQIAGIVVGVVVFVGAFALIIYCCVRRQVIRGGVVPQPGVPITTYTQPIVTTTPIISVPPPAYPSPVQPGYQAPPVQPQYYQAPPVY